MRGIMESEMNGMDAAQDSTLGAVLIKSREEAGFSQEEIAKKLFLSVTYIQYLENNDFDKLCQSIVFIRGYVRGYARLIGLDEVKVNRLLDESGVVQKKEPAKISLPRSRRQTSVKDKKMRWATYLIVLVLIVLVLTWWHSQVAHKQATQVKAPEITQSSASTQNVIASSPTSTAKQETKTLPLTSNVIDSGSTPPAQKAANKNLTTKLHMDIGNS